MGVGFDPKRPHLAVQSEKGPKEGAVPTISMPWTPTSWPGCPQGKTQVGKGEARVWEDFHLLLLGHYLLLGKELDEPSAVLPGKKKAWEENKNENKSDIMREPCGNVGGAFS